MLECCDNERGRLFDDCNWWNSWYFRFIDMAHKKLFFKLLTVFILVTAIVMPVSALAQTEASAKPGTFFYFVDTTFEKVGLFFTFNSEKKARKALGYADKRLAEIELIDETQKPDVLKSLIANYENNIALAIEKSKEVSDKEKSESLFTSISENTSKNQEVLSAVLIKVPEEAKEAIMQAIEVSKKNNEEATKQITELKEEVEELKTEIQSLKEELEKKEEKKFQDISKDEDKNEQKEIENLKKDIEKLEKEVRQPETNKPITPPVLSETQEKQDFVKLTFTSPNGYFTNERIFFNPAINKQQIDVLVDTGWKIVDSHLSESISFGTKKESSDESEIVKNETLQITNINVIPSRISAIIELQTNKLSE